MTDIWSWPSGSPVRTRSFRLRAFNISALAAQTQELIPGGVMVQRFEAGLALPPQSSAQWRELDGLVAALRGTDGKIRLWDHYRKEPYYNATVTETSSNWTNSDSPPVESTWDDGTGWSAGKLPPYVSVGETGRRGVSNLLLKGFPASLDGVLRRGDLMEIRPNGIPSEFAHLYVVTRWANSNASGESRVYFEPGLRRGVRTGDQAVIGGAGDYPKSVFRLASDDEGEIEVDPAQHASIGLRFIEVLPHG